MANKARMSMKTNNNDNMSLIRLLCPSPPALHGNSVGHPPGTRRDEGPQRRAKCAHLCATTLEKSTTDPGISMKTNDNDNLSDGASCQARVGGGAPRMQQTRYTGGRGGIPVRSGEGGSYHLTFDCGLFSSEARPAV